VLLCLVFLTKAFPMP
ncbi:putative cardiolipin synthetase, partial [Streptococcus dysgalactiae subsp. equisimilis]